MARAKKVWIGFRFARQASADIVASLAMTKKHLDEDTLRVPAARNARVMQHACRPSRREGAGNAGCWPHPWPACNKKCRRQEPQVSRSNPAFPARWVTAYTRSPRCAGLVSHRRLARPKALRGLIPASGNQDHAISLSALRIARLATPARPPHPESRLRRLAKRPSEAIQDARIKPYFSEKRKRKFAAGGWNPGSI